MTSASEELKHLHELLRKGNCCAVALVKMALEKRGEQNNQLLEAMSTLCNGVQAGLLCGALTGAAAMMSILVPDQVNREMISQLSHWFVETIGTEYGGCDCQAILDSSPINRTTRCPGVIEATYLKARELIEYNGIDCQ